MKAFFLSALESAEWSLLSGSVRNLVTAFFASIVIGLALGAGAANAAAKTTTAQKAPEPTLEEYVVYVLSGGTVSPQSSRTTSQRL